LTDPAKAAAVAVASGLILSVAFPEPDIAPLAWVALVPLLLALRGKRTIHGFWIGFAFGFAFFGALIIWISIVGWISWAVLVLVETAFIGVFGAFVAWLSRRRLSVSLEIVVTAAAWVALELARQSFPVSGFSWGQLAQSQHNLPWMLRIAGLAGGWGVAFVIVAVNACLAHALLTLRSRRGRGVTLVGVAALLIVVPFALPSNDATGEVLRVAIVQGNIPENMEQSFAKDEIIVANHIELTKQLAGKDIDLVVWPESSVGIDIERFPEVHAQVAAAARAVGAPMIVGATSEAGDKYKVMALLLSPDGEIIDRYQKTHLVPFGEYVPGRGLIGSLPILDQVPRDAIPGTGVANVEPFEVGGGPVSTVVSFEGDFGSLVRSRIAGGGRLLVVDTNTSTWGHSWASAQHLAFSQVRAAENGTYVVHAALTGISGVIAPDGRVVHRSPLWEPATVIQDVRFAEDITLYARWGDWLVWACVLLVVGTIVQARLRRTPTEEAA
jgi:apolipoprotein N-acyltransferase